MNQTSNSFTIAIVGNVVAVEGEDNRRRAQEACVEIGRQLAQRGYEIVVYSSDPRYIEPFVVAGYISSIDAKHQCIHVRYPETGATINFSEARTHSWLFQWHPDTRPDWEMSFYESIGAVDGVLLIGGGASTLTAGLFAITHEKSIVAFPTFGGSARKIWAELRARTDWLTNEEHQLLAQPSFSKDIAAAAVSLFEKQAARRALRRKNESATAANASSQRRRNAAIAAVGFTVFLSLLMTSLAIEINRLELLFALLLAGPSLAGIAGVTARTLDTSQEDGSAIEATSVGQNIVRGLVAGGVAALLTVLPAVVSRPEIPRSLSVGKEAELKDIEKDLRRDQIRKLIPMAIVSGFLAGFAADQFYRKLKARDLEISKV